METNNETKRTTRTVVKSGIHLRHLPCHGDLLCELALGGLGDCPRPSQWVYVIYYLIRY